MTRYLFLEINSDSKKTHSTWTPTIYNDHGNVIKFVKVTSNSTQYKKRRKTKTSFPKESEENADLHKPVLNKIMITHK